MVDVKEQIAVKNAGTPRVTAKGEINLKSAAAVNVDAVFKHRNMIIQK